MLSFFLLFIVLLLLLPTIPPLREFLNFWNNDLLLFFSLGNFFFYVTRRYSFLHDTIIDPWRNDSLSFTCNY
ncbi:hypothetical protein QBC38DRAFT_97971 [Podospora fimiseda]|uniref:Uncharacterized protein n=1 Tax=Podospora fimiseda TaxID=252190 RepID=A0AAN7H352_9PEZI|nr:hypothetical protein QBC38DRAFT_97971 [Podospora fimiseda]